MWSASKAECIQVLIVAHLLIDEGLEKVGLGSPGGAGPSWNYCYEKLLTYWNNIVFIKN